MEKIIFNCLWSTTYPYNKSKSASSKPNFEVSPRLKIFSLSPTLLYWCPAVLRDTSLQYISWSCSFLFLYLRKRLELCALVNLSAPQLLNTFCNRKSGRHMKNQVSAMAKNNCHFLASSSVLKSIPMESDLLEQKFSTGFCIWPNNIKKNKIVKPLFKENIDITVSLFLCCTASDLVTRQTKENECSETWTSRSTNNLRSLSFSSTAWNMQS